ncbi:hypothetical protein TREES_T100006458 [Tupaia chinensis]|uniref:Uncharacterized protein n=1 Tax=Tupaia chinensis TaxID=246437 RepID=L9KW51_TUPCH|nr:hypothetical protein TREES_T100006458 [Tupaia chinensis]
MDTPPNPVVAAPQRRWLRLHSLHTSCLVPHFPRFRLSVDVGQEAATGWGGGGGTHGQNGRAHGTEDKGGRGPGRKPVTVPEPDKAPDIRGEGLLLDSMAQQPGGVLTAQAVGAWHPSLSWKPAR